MPLDELGLKELAVVAFRIQTYGFIPTLVATVLVYPLIFILRYALFALGIAVHCRRHHNDAQIIRGADQPFKQRTFATHLAYALLLSPEGLWLALGIAITPKDIAGMAIVIGLQVALFVGIMISIPPVPVGLHLVLDEELVDRLWLRAFTGEDPVHIDDDTLEDIIREKTVCILSK
ncbi:hypothetical protein LTS10_006752 [Elasticomyces elasticus]|nr:hypothetical protein LTS10_006752 [Elasticomyces elasticus]